MKITIELPDDLFKQAKSHAEAHQIKLKTLVEQGLRKVMAEEPMGKPFKLRDASVGGNGQTPEFQHAKWEQIRDAIY